MYVHVFAGHGGETYLVEAKSEVEAKGKMWETKTISAVEYLGLVEEVLGDEDVVETKP